MKMIITADWHLRQTPPRCRIDKDWINTQSNALKQIVAYANEYQCNVCCVGDLFHSNNDTSFECIHIVQDMAMQLKNNGYSLFILAGNHDLPYHSTQNITKSAIGLLSRSENIFFIDMFDTDDFVSAPNFDEEVNPNANIVFRHVLTFKDKKDLPPNVEALTAQDLLDMYPNAEWIFTGDMHKNFHYENKGRHVVNSGCLLRQASDFKDYQCGVYFVDTENNIVKFLPIIDDKELVDDTYITINNEREQRINNFVNKLKNTKAISLNFVENVNNALLTNNIKPEVKQMVEQLMEV